MRPLKQPLKQFGFQSHDKLDWIIDTLWDFLYLLNYIIAWKKLIPHDVRGNRKSRSDTINAELEIRRLMDDNNSDIKIMNILQIPKSTYYRRKSKIYKQDKEVWLQITQESLESRALKLLRSLQNAYEINKKIAEDETNPDTRARIQASQVMVMTQGHMLKLTIEGPNLSSYLASRGNNGDRGHLIVLKPKEDNIQKK